MSQSFLPWLCYLLFLNLFAANAGHLMSPLQPTSAAYNPMVGAATGPYGHPYGSGHPPPPPMHGLPPPHMHSHQQQNPHMMSVQNGPVILVSNLNEDVSERNVEYLSKSFSLLIKTEKAYLSNIYSFLSLFFLFRTIR